MLRQRVHGRNHKDRTEQFFSFFAEPQLTESSLNYGNDPRTRLDPNGQKKSLEPLRLTLAAVTRGFPTEK
jgi:hypothetical protein